MPRHRRTPLRFGKRPTACGVRTTGAFLAVLMVAGAALGGQALAQNRSVVNTAAHDSSCPPSVAHSPGDDVSHNPLKGVVTATPFADLGRTGESLSFRLRPNLLAYGPGRDRAEHARLHGEPVAETPEDGEDRTKNPARTERRALLARQDALRREAASIRGREREAQTQLSRLNAEYQTLRRDIEETDRLVEERIAQLRTRFGGAPANDADLNAKIHALQRQVYYTDHYIAMRRRMSFLENAIARMENNDLTDEGDDERLDEIHRELAAIDQGLTAPDRHDPDRQTPPNPEDPGDLSSGVRVGVNLATGALTDNGRTVCP